MKPDDYNSYSINKRQWGSYGENIIDEIHQEALKGHDKSYIEDVLKEIKKELDTMGRYTSKSNANIPVYGPDDDIPVKELVTLIFTLLEQMLDMHRNSQGVYSLPYPITPGATREDTYKILKNYVRQIKEMLSGLV